MPNFLVVSYDPDQQQWFYDTVESANGDMAEAYILKVRDYVTCAEAKSLEEMTELTRMVREDDAEYQTDDRLCQCGDCGQITKESELDEIEDLTERIIPGDEVPAGQCAECGALAHLIPLEEIYGEEVAKRP